MNVLFVGSGSGGSWQIRGVQIGAALCARVTSRPSPDDWQWADLVVLVKHAAEQFGEEAAASGARIIWDVLDWWKQPDDNQSAISDVMQDVRAMQKRHVIHKLIGATQAMADEIDGVYIPHHSREGMVPTPIRDRIEVIAYEGTPKYLGPWKQILEQTADMIGAAFVVNPKRLSDADVVVAFRGGKWDGPICRRWKSGVKLVNAIAIGRPVIAQRSEAFFETSPCGAIVTEPAELMGMVQLFASAQSRRDVLERSRELAPDFTLETTVLRYRHLFDQVMRRAA